MGPIKLVFIYSFKFTKSILQNHSIIISYFQDDTDNSKTDDESNTEAEDVGEAGNASDSASDLKANTKYNFKKPLAKPQVKHPFKAVAATHVRLQKQMHVQS